MANKRVLESDNESSNDDLEVAEADPPPKKKRNSRPSAKKAATDKENDDADQVQLAKAMKKAQRLQAKVAKASQASAAATEDDELESEEEQNPRSASSSVLASITAPSTTKKINLRRMGTAAPKSTPHVPVKAFKSIPARHDSSPDVVIGQRPENNDTFPSDDVFFLNKPTPLTSHAPAAIQAPATGTPTAAPATANPLSAPPAASTPSTTTTITANTSGKEVPQSTDPVVKMPALREGVKRDPKNPKASDFEETVTTLILRAALEYEALISSSNAFPDTATRLKWAKKCWKNAGVDAEESYQMTDPISILLRQQGSRIRGIAITCVQQRVETVFGFECKCDPRTIAKNKGLYTKLKNDSSFHFKDPEMKKGFAQGKIIAECLQAIWFENKDSHGVVFEKYFKPVRLETMALIFTLVNFALDGWSSGTFTTAKMWEKDVINRHRVFQGHIKQWNMSNEKVVQAMHTKFYIRARHDAGAAEETLPKSSLTDEALKCMHEELEGHTGETDSEAEAEGEGEGEAEGEDGDE